MRTVILPDLHRHMDGVVCPKCGGHVQYLDPGTLLEENKGGIARLVVEITGDVGTAIYACVCCQFRTTYFHELADRGKPNAPDRCPRCGASGWYGDFCYCCGYCA